MVEQASTGWQIEIDQPEHLVIGLFVRDVAGLRGSHTWLPHCSPKVAGSMVKEGSAVAAQQWDLWWDKALSTSWNGPDQRQDQLAGVWWSEPGFESLQSAPALQEIVARHFDDARQWSADRRQEHIGLMIGTPEPGLFHGERHTGRGLFETTLVSGLEHDLRRHARPFQLHVTVIPVAGKELWQLAPHRVLLTDELLRDSAEYRRRLTPVVQRLL